MNAYRWFQTATAGGGLLLAAGMFAGGFFAGEQAKPVERATDVASSPGAVHSYCPDGWGADVVNVDGEHVQALLCLRNEITVILSPSGEFNIAETGGGFIENEDEVPGWAR